MTKLLIRCSYPEEGGSWNGHVPETMLKLDSHADLLRAWGWIRAMLYQSTAEYR